MDNLQPQSCQECGQTIQVALWGSHSAGMRSPTLRGHSLSKVAVCQVTIVSVSLNTFTDHSHQAVVLLLSRQNAGKLIHNCQFDDRGGMATLFDNALTLLCYTKLLALRLPDQMPH